MTTVPGLIDVNALALPALFEHLADDRSLRVLDEAVHEDLGDRGDVTTNSIIDADARGQATLVARDPGVVAGLAAAGALPARIQRDVRLEPILNDGDACAAAAPLAAISGSLRDLLTLERTVLNIVGRLCGIATHTRGFVERVQGTGAVICDTRKTTPGWRRLEKYAVRCGGGTLHRLGLDDAALYKDNHLAALGASFGEPLADAIRAARADRALRFVEIEVDDHAQLEQVLDMPEGLVDIVLLDNMSHDGLRAAVAARDERRPRLFLEASGNVSLDTVRAIAETGVDRISVGAITHAARWLDIGMDLLA